MVHDVFHIMLPVLFIETNHVSIWIYHDDFGASVLADVTPHSTRVVSWTIPIKPITSQVERSDF